MGTVLMALVAIALGAQSDPTAPLEGVVELKPEGFTEAVEDGRNWLVEFYAPWCGWCKKLVPVWKELGAAVGEHAKVAVAKFDATQQDAGAISEAYNIQGFPTILLLKPDGSRVKFTKTRNLQGFAAFLKAETDISILDDEAALVTEAEPGRVLALTDRNAEAVINDPTKNVIVKFYAPWCGHCKAMEPTWANLAAQNPHADVVIAKLDADRYGTVGESYGIRGFPTVKFFKKTDKTGDEYTGQRNEDDLQAYIDSRKD